MEDGVEWFAAKPGRARVHGTSIVMMDMATAV